MKRANFTSYYFVHNINMFAKCGGFEAIWHVISQGTIGDQRGNGSGISMLKVCLAVLTMMGQIKNFLVESFWVSGEEYGKRVAIACAEFVKNRCTSEDLRLATKKDITFFSSNVESILDSIAVNLSNEEKAELVYKISETLELDIALKCLKIHILEKKLIGHQILIAQI